MSQTDLLLGTRVQWQSEHTSLSQTQFGFYSLFKPLWCRAGSRNTFTLCHFEKAVNIHKAKSVNEAICHWQGMDGDALLKTRRPLVFAGSTVCLFDWVCTWKLQDMCVWTVGILMRAWKQKQKGNWFTFCCSSVSTETGNRLQRSSAPGHFYRLLLPLYPHRREVSWRGLFRGFSRTSCSGFYSAFCFTF